MMSQLGMCLTASKLEAQSSKIKRRNKNEFKTTIDNDDATIANTY